MAFYFRDSPRFADRLRGKSGDELLQEIKQRLNEDNDAFFEPARHTTRDPFERHASSFSRGFPFDDDDEDGSFVRRGDGGIRAHLDDLASRHPELAEHLLGPPWGDAPLHGSLLRGRRRRRDSGSSGGQGYHGHQVDEDTRSQASGSSAASGASAVSSHSGEPDSSGSVPSSSSIPQYGLRNTVDIGQQQRRGMENVERNVERGQRSMSAPPENRQQQQFEQQQQPQQPQSQPTGQAQRFVSRVDITPQHNQQQQRAQSPKPTPPSGNVRHIPIFVEGRDEPVMSKVRDDTPPPSSFQRQTSPPHFNRPSHFNDRFARQQWPPSHFQNTFYEPAGFEQPAARRHQQFQQQQPQYHYHQQQQQQPQQPQYHHQQQQQQQPQYHHQQHHQQPQETQYHQQQPEQQQQQPQQEEQEIPKPKPTVPKDALEKVAQVQKDVDDLAVEVRRYVGGSRQDKEYVYLDEMLTRELIKLDDIETEGRENVRQARKNAIKSIQDTISLLETKAPLAAQQQQQSRGEEEGCAEKDQREEISRTESMEVDPKQEKQSNEPIPLPPAPSSPTKTKAESSADEGNVATAAVESTNTATEEKPEDRTAKNTEQSVTPTLTDEQRRTEETGSEETKTSDRKDANEATQTTVKKDATTIPAAEEKVPKETGKTEVNGQNRTESPRVQKKTKKTKKQQQQPLPVSEQAIPLPPPPPTESAAK